VAPGTYQVVITGTATTNTALVHNTVVTVVVTATPTLQNGTYTMTNLSSALLMTDTNDSGTSGTQVEQFTANNTSDQQWIFSYQGNGLYTIQSAANPNLYITDPGDADTTSPVVVATLTPLNLNDVGSQLWTFNLLEGGYQIVNYNSSGVLDDDAFGATNGTPVLVYPEKSVVDSPATSWGLFLKNSKPQNKSPALEQGICFEASFATAARRSVLIRRPGQSASSV
jgi:hypothetical protein